MSYPYNVLPPDHRSLRVWITMHSRLNLVCLLVIFPMRPRIRLCIQYYAHSDDSINQESQLELIENEQSRLTAEAATLLIYTPMKREKSSEYGRVSKKCCYTRRGINSSGLWLSSLCANVRADDREVHTSLRVYHKIEASSNNHPSGTGARFI